MVIMIFSFVRSSVSEDHDFNFCKISSLFKTFFKYNISNSQNKTPKKLSVHPKDSIGPRVCASVGQTIGDTGNPLIPHFHTPINVGVVHMPGAHGLRRWVCGIKCCIMHTVLLTWQYTT